MKLNILFLHLNFFKANVIRLHYHEIEHIIMLLTFKKKIKANVIRLHYHEIERIMILTFLKN